MTLQKLTVVGNLEWKMAMLCRGLFEWLHRKKFDYQNGRFYLTRLVIGQQEENVVLHSSVFMDDTRDMTETRDIQASITSL